MVDDPQIDRRRRWTRLAVAVPSAAVASLLLRVNLPRGLDVRTDVVGYPIHKNFDVFGNFRTFEVAAIVFPLLTLAVYLLLGLALHVPRRGLRAPRLPPVLVPEPPYVETDGRGALGRRLFTGAVIGLEVAFIRRAPGGFWLVVAGCAVAYVGALAAAAHLRWHGLPETTTGGRHSALNALATPLTVLLLYGVSARTRVTVLLDGSVRSEPWLPIAVVAPATVALLAVLVRAVTRARTDQDLRRIERKAVLLVAGSVGLFLVLARLHTALGSIDFFHDGEVLVPADLVGRGAFPWRDLIFLHGIMEDVLRSSIGMLAFGNNMWAGFAGQTVLLAPLYWIGLYLLYVYLFGRSWLFLVLTTTLLVQGWMTPALIRLLLVPYVLLALAALLRRATAARAALFVALGLASVVLTPESALAVGAAAVTLVAFEVWYREPGAPLLHSLRRTAWCAAASVAGLALWCGYLAVNGALDDFFYVTRSFVPDHELTGGIPVTGEGFDYWFAILVPAGAAVLSLWWFGARLAGRRPVAVTDWVVAAVAVFVLLYVRKFLSRADGHAFHVLAVALPMLYYAVFLLVDRAESALRRRSWGGRMARVANAHPVTLALIVAVIAATPGPPLGDIGANLPHRWDVDMAEWNPRLGYSNATAVDPTMLSDVQAALDALLEPGDRLFDMSNTPALFHYILRTEPATRYYHLSMAIRKRNQADLIDELRKARPKVVVLDGGYGISNWDDITNTVRHYDVARYVLQEYRPLVWVRSNLLLLRNDVEPPSLDSVARRVTQPIATERLYADFRACDWGYAPEFLKGGPTDAARTRAVSVPFTTARAGRGQDVAITIPPGLRLRDFGHLEIETARPLAADSFALSQPPDGSRFPISFKSRADGDTRYSVLVGSCPQWYAFTATAGLILHSDKAEEITAVRLYR